MAKPDAQVERSSSEHFGMSSPSAVRTAPRGPRGGKPNPNRERYAAIGEQLRRVYDGVVGEPVPAELLALLRDPGTDGESMISEQKGEVRS